MKTHIDQAVDRFLCWKLPHDFVPDCYISFDIDRASLYTWPIGTNLLHAGQAKAMLEHVCEPLLTAMQERDAEIANLHTTMMAAAVEISEHWDAHCDDEGYGPCNLVRRLENGFPAQYGYDAKTVVRMEAKLAAQRKVLEQASEALENGRRVRYGEGGTQFQPPLEDATITAIQEQLK